MEVISTHKNMVGIKGKNACSKMTYSNKCKYDDCGLFAASDITVGDVLFTKQVDSTKMQALVKLLMDSGYPHDVDHVVQFSELRLKYCPAALKNLVEKKKRMILEEKEKDMNDHLFLKYFLLVLAKAYRFYEKYVLVEQLHYVKRKADGNVKVCLSQDNTLTLRAIKYIEAGSECVVDVDVQNNYTSMLTYGDVINHPLLHLCYGTVEVPISLRKNLNYSKFSDTFEYQLDMGYMGGTKELFSFIRFLHNPNENENSCPTSLVGFRYDVVSKENEIATLRFLLKVLDDIPLRKAIAQNKGTLKSFCNSQMMVLQHWKAILTSAIDLLEAKTLKDAKKIYTTTNANDYFLHVLNRFLKKKFYA